MRRSIILNATYRLLMGMLLIFSVFLLFRGHNLPGGGFNGGLVAGCAFVLHALAFGEEAARRLLLFDPRTVIGAGLVVAAASGMAAWLEGLPYLTGLWGDWSLPLLGKLGTPLLFDLGVYLLVLGVVCLLIFELSRKEEGRR